MKSSIPALFVATACAWFVGVALSGRGAFHMSGGWSIAALTASSLLAWLVARGFGDVRLLSTAWMWLLYETLLASTCAWYVALRGAVLYAELVLPTMAVWLVFVPVRIWVGRRFADSPRTGADARPPHPPPRPTQRSAHRTERPQ